MVSLPARSAVEGLVPFEAGGVRLEELTPGYITHLALRRGQEAALAAALKAAEGPNLPGPGRATGGAAARVLWAGYGQYLLIGAAPADPALAAHAAAVDVSDGWTLFRLSGAGAEAVLAWLTPLDLGPARFRRGHVARSELAHMAAIFTRTRSGIELLVPRSFAATAARRIAEAMTGHAARARIGE